MLAQWQSARMITETPVSDPPTSDQILNLEKGDDAMIDFNRASRLFGPHYNKDHSLPDGEEDEFSENDNELVLVNSGCYGSGDTWKYRGITYFEDEDGTCTIDRDGKHLVFKSGKAVDEYIRSITPNYTNRAFKQRAAKDAKMKTTKFIIPDQLLTGVDVFMKYKGHIIGYCNKDSKFYVDIDSKKGYDNLSDAALSIEGIGKN
jgi:hypothetical protein